MKYRILKIALCAWVATWLFLVARELILKENLSEYAILSGRSLEGKRARVTGEDLYSFLKFCDAALPPGATYGLSGVEDGSIEKRRAVYYLYPLLERPAPDYMLIYGSAPAALAGYQESAADEHGRVFRKMGVAR